MVHGFGLSPGYWRSSWFLELGASQPLSSLNLRLFPFVVNGFVFAERYFEIVYMSLFMKISFYSFGLSVQT